MSSSTVTSKGQITIPIDVRTKLRLQPGSRLAFVLNESGGYEIYPETASIRDLKGAVPRPTESVSIDEMNEAIAAAATVDAR